MIWLIVLGIIIFIAAIYTDSTWVFAGGMSVWLVLAVPYFAELPDVKYEPPTNNKISAYDSICDTRGGVVTRVINGRLIMSTSVTYICKDGYTQTFYTD